MDQQAIQLQEREVGDCRIYAGAFVADRGGYTAAVEVRHIVASAAPEVVFTNARLFGGHRFDEPAAALRHAMDVGHQAIRLRDALAS